MNELWALSAAEISKLFKTKEVSALEICNATIQHIEEINPKLLEKLRDHYRKDLSLLKRILGVDLNVE